MKTAEKFKNIVKNEIHVNNRSHVTQIIDVNGKKVKLMYECYNASESCNAYIFDGNQWNCILTIHDLGMFPDSSFYVNNELNRKTRSLDLIGKLIDMLLLFI